MVQNTVDINHTNTSVIRYSASRPKVSKYSLQSCLISAIMMNDYYMTKFSRFAVKLFFISFELSASIVLVAAFDHRPSCVSQRSDD